MSSDKLENDYSSFVRKVEAQVQADREKVKADLLALKAKADSSSDSA